MANLPAAALNSASTGWRYGLLGLPLAFVALPLYVNLPRYSAEHYAIPLATLGALLLGTRLLDALLDPRIGRLVDQLFSAERAGAPARRAWQAAALASLLMAAGFAALWWPPQTLLQRPAALLGWLAGALVLCSLSYSVVSVVHQSWAARWGGPPEQRAGLIAWREGAALAGVLVASVLPAWLGWQASSVALALSLALGLWALRLTLPAQAVAAQPTTADDLQPALHPAPAAAQAPAANGPAAQANPQPTASLPSASPPTAAPHPADQSPWATPAFGALLGVFMLNGTASALPATLLPFFVRETLQSPAWEPLFLASYFGAAALALPLWVRLVARLGLARCWLLGMGLSVFAFASVALLGPGDSAAFEAICLLSGLALGADLVVPTALLTGVIHQAGLGGQSEGRFLGWWTAAAKLNLALASGLGLPLLALLGFQIGQHSPTNQSALAIGYGLLPCLFKLLAAGALWRGMQRHPVLGDTA